MSRASRILWNPLVAPLLFAILGAACLGAVVYGLWNEKVLDVFAMGAGFFIIAFVSRLAKAGDVRPRGSKIERLGSPSLVGSSIVARNVDILYALSSEPFRAEERPFAVLDYSIQFELHNRGSNRETLFIPVRAPQNYGRGNFDPARVEVAQIGNRIMNSKEVEEYAHKDESGALSYRFEADLKPGESILIRMRAIARKDITDSEIWTFPFAVEQQVGVRLIAPPWLSHGFESLGGQGMKILDRGPTNSMAQLSGPLPPFPTIVTWWRPEPDTVRP
jgi:hypothetical protein